jgi:beta-galactosidase
MPIRVFWFLCAAVFAVAVHAGEPTPDGRERLRMDAGWRFALGHATDLARDFDYGTGYFSDEAKAGFGDGPAAATFDDRAWRRIDLPHDWAAEAPFAPNASPSHGFKAIGRNFPERSVGWYRKSFSIPSSDLGRRISLEFDGVFRDSVVWVNGFRLGRHESGYSSFRYDISDYLNYGGDNVVSVRVDASKEEGWFYEGAGIYRHVWLTTTAPLHVAHWGTFVTTEVGDDRARVTARTTVRNDRDAPATFELEQTVLDPEGNVVARGVVRDGSLPAGATGEFPCELTVARPRLWSLETPLLHRLVTLVRSGGTVVDRYETPFGIRSARFDPDRGFFLNGRRVELQGVNLHQDHAGVGVAIPDALQSYRLKQLKEFGVNAIRCSHNPPAPEFLDDCDRLGLLVIDENRLMGSSPRELDELASMIRRDRNHPSVILWSLGNEEWAIEGNIRGARITSTMQAFAQRLDPSRRMTVAISGGWGGTSTVVDVAGYNYINQSNPDEQHAKFPRQPGVGTEETSTQGTRGVFFDDRAHVHLAPQPRGDTGGNFEKGWKYYEARPFLAGLFYWTGLDYRGEPTPFGWPAIASQFGLLDLCGFPKDPAYYLKAWWTGQPVLHLYPHWNWPGREGQPIQVVCFSNDEAVELFLNGTSLGKKEVPRNGHLEWTMTYAPGTLEARGYRHGAVRGTAKVETTGGAAALVVTPDRPTTPPERTDAVVFAISANDSDGRHVPDANNLVKFEVSGGEIIGVGNGDPGSHEADRFIPSVTSIAVDDWRGRIVPAGTALASDRSTLTPMPQLGNWQAPRPKPGEVYEFDATVTFDGAPADATLALYLPSFGAKTSVWLDGHELAHETDTTHEGPAIRIEPSQLRRGANRLQFVIVPFADGQKHIPETSRIGCLAVESPAPAAQRSLFNGYAQVIVRPFREAGIVRLRASADGLTPAEVSVTVPQH